MKGLILTVGFTTAPLIFTIKKEKPTKIVFIGTDTLIDKCINTIIKECELAFSDSNILRITDSPDAIGLCISKFNEGYNWLLRKGITKENVIVDATGGTKWMSSGATMIASFLGLRMIYVDVKYIDGKPDSDTMKIVSFGNAYDQTGFILSEQGQKAFNNYDFDLAKEYFSEIRPSQSNRAEFFKGLAKMCSAFAKWDRFEHYSNKISNEFYEAIELIERAMKSGLGSQELVNFVSELKSFVIRLEENESLKSINDNFILDVFFNAKRRFELKRYDDSTARLYRTLEAISQFFLKKDLGIDSSEKLNWEGVENKVQSAYLELTHDNEPLRTIGLKSGFMFLHANEHNVGKALIKKGKKGTNFILEPILNKRNNSILAHGFDPVGFDDNKDFISKIDELLSKEIKNYTELSEIFKLPKLPNLNFK